MILSPQFVIDSGWITFPHHFTQEQIQQCIQPNAIDFTLDKLYRLEDNCLRPPAHIYTDSKHLFEYPEVPTTLEYGSHDRQLEAWDVKPPYVYDGMSLFTINVPESVAVTLIVRSTFNRCGLQLVSGLYDQGFNNNIGFVLYPHMPLQIERGTRIGQVVFHTAQSDGQLYNGSYSKPQDGEHWSHQLTSGAK